MIIASDVALRATCPVLSVGAVFVNKYTKSILTTGYNGAPRGLNHCGDECFNRKLGDKSNCRAIHAEMNAIFNAALNGVKLEHAVVYLTISPCEPCAKALIQVGIDEVVYIDTYVHTEALEWLSEAGISYRRYLNVV